MPIYKQLPKEKSKSHNEFKDWTVHAIEWLAKNRKGAGEFAIVVVAIGLILLGAQWYFNSRSSVSTDALYSASKLERGSEAQINELEKISNDYSRTPAGREAMMSLAKIYIEKKEYDKAIEKLKILSGRSRNIPMLNVAALHLMAQAEGLKGDYAKAAEVYLKAAADPHNLVKLTSRFYAAKCYELTNDYDKASKMYQQIIEESKEDDGLIRARSEERLLWLMANNRISG